MTQQKSKSSVVPNQKNTICQPLPCPLYAASNSAIITRILWDIAQQGSLTLPIHTFSPVSQSKLGQWEDHEASDLHKELQGAKERWEWKGLPQEEYTTKYPTSNGQHWREKMEGEVA